MRELNSDDPSPIRDDLDGTCLTDFKDDDLVRSYLKQVGNLIRLTHDEELFHIDSFFQEREKLKGCLCYFPKIIYSRLITCRTGGMIEHYRDGDDDVNVQYNKRDRIILLLNAIQKTSDKLDDSSDLTQYNKCRDSFHGILEKLLSGIQFEWSFYQSCIGHLEKACNDISSTGDDSVNEKEAKEISLAKSLVPSMMPSDDFQKLYNEINNHFNAMESSRKTLVEGNLRLVISVAKKYMYCGVHFLDLIQEGNIGILMAVDKFQPEKGHRFSTYAVWWIRQAVTSSLSKNSRTIRIPANIANQISQINRTEESYIQQNGYEATTQEVSNLIDISVERIRALKKMEKQTVSLQSVNKNDVEMNKIIVDEKSQSLFETASSNLLTETIDEVLHTLKDRERNIIIHRFGLFNKSKMTLEELSEQYHVTLERIRQIEVMALQKLRHPTRKKFFDGYL